jgi:hypothetical protein
MRPHQNLLWQRLSETLQNRRKYLLDKRLGKRKFSTSTQPQPSVNHPSSAYQPSSTTPRWSFESRQNLSEMIRDAEEWQTLSFQNHLRPFCDENEAMGVNVKAEPADN